jgi:hypothetical protein
MRTVDSNRTGTTIAAILVLLLVASSVAAQPVAPEARGFNVPTLKGDWRFRLALNRWIPETSRHPSRRSRAAEAASHQRRGRVSWPPPGRGPVSRCRIGELPRQLPGRTFRICQSGVDHALAHRRGNAIPVAPGCRRLGREPCVALRLVAPRPGAEGCAIHPSSWSVWRTERSDPSTSRMTSRFSAPVRGTYRPPSQRPSRFF